MTTALDRLRKKYADAIKSKELELDLLKAKLAVIEEVGEEAKHLELGIGDSRRYAGKGLTEAALEAVSELGEAAAGQVHKHLIANGFRSASANLPVSVITTLKRLARTGRINSTMVEGKRIYRPKS